MCTPRFTRMTAGRRDTGRVAVRVDGQVVLADVAGLGPFFAVSTDPAESADPTWRPVRDLQTDPEPLRARIGQVARALSRGTADGGACGAGGVGKHSEDRVAASIAFQGYAAALVSAPFAAAVLHEVVPALTPEALHWRPSASGPLRLWSAAPDVRPVGELAGLLGAHLEPLVAAVRAQVPVSERVLWGNAASALAGAKRVLGSARPHAAERAAGLAGELLATGRLAGTGELLAPEPPDRAWTFRRRSCCLYYRVPGGGLCGDCVLQAR
jgi:ferric iron reductase protein FhuF